MGHNASMEPLVFQALRCPYCGETFEIALDLTQPSGEPFIEDCQVCCRPIELRLWAADGDWRLEVRRDDE